MRARTQVRAIGIASAWLGAASAAAAHPGHGLGGGSESWLHYLTEPLHVAPLAFVALTLVLASRRWRRRVRVRSRIR